jgi:hypothetical protein
MYDFILLSLPRGDDFFPCLFFDGDAAAVLHSEP